ncbi:MAG: ATP-dependent RecD-like DNA helicase, partial [Parachlamydiaceae bacterium]
ILPYDLIVCDEASMIDLKMMIRLLKSVKKNARLVLLGDSNQLPAIDAGAPFQAIVEYLKINPLKTCLRSDLVELTDFYELILKGDAEKVIEYLKSSDRKNLALKPLEIPSCHPLLTPMKQGPYGVNQINRVHSKRGDIPIIILENDEEFELFNGDMGFIRQNRAWIGGREFPINLLPRYDYAYALSIHKSQGSEFDQVHLLLPEGAEEFGRNLLYTGATRAKKSLTLYANEETIRKTIASPSTRIFKKI